MRGRRPYNIKKKESEKMSINYASKYSDKVDEKFKLGAVTTPAVNTEYDFAGVNTVNVYSLPTVAMGNYAASGTNRYGTPAELQDSVQTLTLTQDRAFTYTIDRRNYTDTQMVKEAGKSLSRQIELEVIPEIDVYRLAKIAAGAGTSATLALTKNNAYEAFLNGTAALTENKAPLAGRLAFVNPLFYKCVKLDSSFIKSGDLAQEMLLQGQIGAVDGIPIILLPTAYLPAGVDFIITHPIATTAPIKISEYKVHDNPPGINGWLIEGRFYYDAFVLTNKAGAIYAHREPQA
jgi:N4-gp56 family major capsid protein